MGHGALGRDRDSGWGTHTIGEGMLQTSEN